MATLHVRNVPEDVYEALRARAKSEGRSINAETIAVLREALRPSPEDLLEQIRSLRARTTLPTGRFAPERIIREDRDAR
jgi:plasmid stability protein